MPLSVFIVSMLVALLIGYVAGCGRGWYLGYWAGRTDEQWKD